MNRIVVAPKAIKKLLEGEKGPVDMTDVRCSSRPGPEGPRVSFLINDETKDMLDKYCQVHKMGYTEAIMSL